MPRRARRDPWSNSPRDALELLARMLVGSAYRQPVEGSGTKAGLQSTEIAAAVGYMKGAKLEGKVAVAVALRSSPRELAVLANAAYRRVCREIRLRARHTGLSMATPADRWRLRLIVYDACCELVWPEHRRPIAELAKATKMRRSAYAEAHKIAMATLQQALNDGRSEFRRRLWGSRGE